MTHCTALEGNRLGLDPGSCPGELVHLGSYPDRTIDRGQVVERTIDLYRCAVCGARLSLTGGTVLNCYRDPGVLVRELAETLGVRR